ncbi:HD-GYP domain-containing protein [Cohnella pontilimi]|uniref:HD-GYP domain-containing protein n=1 Tax=Cohnella pontilimi TaxID=2564100 RepID=A0A4U0FEH2_9BACL|nr:HD-GYP domain-containing protein [Cohnella pontilimi]TJY41692.1 HD-GYP domain-containing protein [Cohnella pontilimi]
MPVVSVSQAHVGDRLLTDVQTALGSVLLQEGRTLSERDLEILQAFLIPSVDVLRAEDYEKIAGSEEIAATTSVKRSTLQKEFAEMEKLLKRSFASAQAGMKLPIFELRNGLTSLLKHIDEYNVLSFVVMSSSGKEDVYVRNGVLCAMTSYMLAKWNNFPEKDWMQIAMAGLLHDIGNVRVDPAILNKPKVLTTEELQEVRQHTVYGFKMLEGGTAINQGVWLAALQHHERVDGSGYPMRVKGDKIHPYAKIIAIADVYHAMTSDRKYKKAESPYLVLEQLQTESFGKLDAVYVQTFIERATQFQNGVFVKLSDGRIGEIVYADRNNPTRPMVSVGGKIVNLMQERQLFIVEVFATS